MLGQENARLAQRIHSLRERNKAQRRRLATYYRADEELARGLSRMMTIQQQNERLLETCKRLKERDDTLEILQGYGPRL